MTSVAKPTALELFRRAAMRATMAPSVHNTQPWQFGLSMEALEIRADWSRQLRVVDPLGRQLLISCGCALFNARVSLAAAGYSVHVARFPHPLDRDLLARITVSGGGLAPAPLGRLDWIAGLRQTNRRLFTDGAAPATMVNDLVAAAEAEGAELASVDDPAHRTAIARLSREAEEFEKADAAYCAELRAWTTDDPHRSDGVPMAAVRPAGAASDDVVPLRDFDAGGGGQLPDRAASVEDQCLLVLGSSRVGRAAWLHVGEALERVLLEVTRRGYSASPLTQVTEVARTNLLLRQALGLSMRPHILLRVGRAARAPTVRRRQLVDVWVDGR